MVGDVFLSKTSPFSVVPVDDGMDDEVASREGIELDVWVDEIVVNGERVDDGERGDDSERVDDGKSVDDGERVDDGESVDDGERVDDDLFSKISLSSFVLVDNVEEES